MWLSDRLREHDRLDLADLVVARVKRPSPGPNNHHPGGHEPEWRSRGPRNGFGDAEVAGAVAIPVAVPDLTALVKPRWFASVLNMAMGSAVTVRPSAVTVPEWSVLEDHTVRLPYLFRDASRIAVGFRAVLPYMVAEFTVLAEPWTVRYRRDDPDGRPRCLDLQATVLRVLPAPSGPSGDRTVPSDGHGGQGIPLEGISRVSRSPSLDLEALSGPKRPT